MTFLDLTLHDWWVALVGAGLSVAAERLLQWFERDGSDATSGAQRIVRRGAMAIAAAALWWLLTRALTLTVVFMAGFAAGLIALWAWRRFRRRERDPRDLAVVESTSEEPTGRLDDLAVQGAESGLT